MVEKFCEQNELRIGSGVGTDDLETLIRALDTSYSNLEDFLDDNPGAQEAIVNWITEQRAEHWHKSLESKISDESEEEPEEGSYDEPDCNRFKKDLEAAGFKVEHYFQRFFWKGPAVMVEREELAKAEEATHVRLQRDQCGLGYVVYPVKRGKLTQEG